MRNPVLLSLLVLSFMGCNKKDADETQNFESCYENAQAGDTVQLSVINDNGKITGSVLYDNRESRGSSGTFTGTQAGDTLKLTVRATKEGKTVYREKYMLIKDNKLYDGIGEVSQLNDTVAGYVNPSDVVYDKGLVFKKVQCDNF